MEDGSQLKALDTIVLNDGGLTAPLAVTRMSDTSAAVCYRNEHDEGVCKLLSVMGDTGGGLRGKGRRLRLRAGAQPATNATQARPTERLRTVSGYTWRLGLTYPHPNPNPSSTPNPNPHPNPNLHPNPNPNPNPNSHPHPTPNPTQVSDYMEVSSEIGSGGRGTYMSVTRLSETTLAWCYTEADNAGAACQQLRLVSAGLRRVRVEVRVEGQGG